MRIKRKNILAIGLGMGMAMASVKTNERIITDRYNFKILKREVSEISSPLVYLI